MISVGSDTVARKNVSFAVYDKMMKEQQYVNFTSATNSDEDFTWINTTRYVPASQSDGDFYDQPKLLALNDINAPFSHTDEYNNLFGRRKTCKSAGLTGAEKRACIKKLRQMGWKQGQPIPSNVTITDEEVSRETTVDQKMPEGMPLWGKISIGAVATIAGILLVSAIAKNVKAKRVIRTVGA